MTLSPTPPEIAALAHLRPVPHTYFAVAAAPAILDRDRLSVAHIDVLDFWLTAADGALPSRAMIDPAKLSRVLRHLILWDVLPDGGGYRCRLAGTAICAAAGRELRGASLEEMHGPGSGIVRKEFDGVRDTREAHFVERTMHWLARPHRLYKRLLLPLAGPAGAVDTLLGVITVQ